MTNEQHLKDNLAEAIDDMLTALVQAQNHVTVSDFADGLLEQMANAISAKYVRDFAAAVNDAVQWFATDAE